MKTFVDPVPVEYSVSRLRLDPNNPRLKMHPGGDKEKEIIERLCTLGSQSPSQVIKHILTDRGYLHNEAPVVLKEPGSSELVVIDGNRRVAALKMVLNPALIPSNRRGLKSDCELLAGLVPGKVRCWVTHNRSDARRIVYRAHNEGSREWESLSKYAAHYDYHKEGHSIVEIVELTGYDQSSVVRQINTWLLVEAMIEHVPDFVIESSGITSFERVTSHYSGFPKEVGISVSEDGLYLIPSNKKLVNLVYKIYLASAGASGFSRQVENNDASRAAFLKKIVPPGFEPGADDDTPDEKTTVNKPKRLNCDAKVDPKGTTSSGSETGRPSPNSGGSLPTERQILLTQKYVGKKAFAIFKEYIGLSGQNQDFPIATAALTRAMIEATLKFHAKRLNCYSETSDQQGRQQSDTLDQVAAKLRQKVAALNLPYSADLLASITNSCKSMSELNDVMHKDGSFAARPAVVSALRALASAVDSLKEIPSKVT